MSDFALLGMHVLMKFCEPCCQAMSRIQVDGTCMEKTSMHLQLENDS